MNDIKEIEKVADEDIRTFGQLIDMVVDELTCGQDALMEAGLEAHSSQATAFLRPSPQQDSPKASREQ